MRGGGGAAGGAAGGLIFRIRSPGGIFRVTLPPTATLGDLYRATAAAVCCEEGQFSLARDAAHAAPLPFSPAAAGGTVRAAGLANGQQLHLRFVSAKAAEAAHAAKFSAAPAGPAKAEPAAGAEAAEPVAAGPAAVACGAGAEPAAPPVFTGPGGSAAAGRHASPPVAAAPEAEKYAARRDAPASGAGGGAGKVSDPAAGSAAGASDASAASAGASGSGAGAPRFQNFDAYLSQAVNFDTSELALSKSFKPVRLVLGQRNVLPPTVSLKHQAYRHVDHVEFRNAAEMAEFVRYWRYETAMQQQRVAWLFGYFVEDSHYARGVRAVVEALYESPASEGCAVRADLAGAQADPFLATATALAKALSLELVGCMFTHPPRAAFLLPGEVLATARAQLRAAAAAPAHYTGYPVAPFVTVTVSLEGDGPDAHVTTNAFMVSDLAMAFERDGMFDEKATEEAGSEKIVLKKAAKQELLPGVLENGADTHAFDADWLLVRLNDSTPVGPVTAFFAATGFPVENRFTAQAPAAVGKYLRSRGVTVRGGAPPGALSDWHLLLYVARLFDESTARSLCAAVAGDAAVDPALLETFLML